MMMIAQRVQVGIGCTGSGDGGMVTSGVGTTTCGGGITMGSIVTAGASGTVITGAGGAGSTMTGGVTSSSAMVKLRTSDQPLLTGPVEDTLIFQ